MTTRNPFQGKHRSRRVRNETLTIVWKYASTVSKDWWAKINGRPLDDSDEAQEHRRRFWRILYGSYNTNREDESKRIEASKVEEEEKDYGRRQTEESVGTATEQGDVELQETLPDETTKVEMK